MKISTIKRSTLIVFCITIFTVSISNSVYKTDVLGEAQKNNTNNKREIIEQVATDLTSEEQETLKLINEYRKENGLDELEPISSLQEVAKLKANDLVENEYFSHTSERLGTPFEMLEQNGVEYMIAGENLAGNTTPKRAVEAWINSQSHRENILEEEFKYTGICVIESPIYGRVFVQLFIGV